MNRHYDVSNSESMRLLTNQNIEHDNLLVLLISIVVLIVVWTQVPDFTNTFTTTQEVHEQK